MSVDIGKIAVTFSANTGELTRGTESAVGSLQEFVRKSQEAQETLSGSFSAGFSEKVDALNEKLKSGALSGEAFAESITSAFERASKAVDAGAGNALETLVKQMQAGTVTGEEFASSLTEIGTRAAAAINSAADDSLSALNDSLDEGKVSADDYVDSVSELAAAEAGAGLDQTRDAIASVSDALAEGAISGDQYLEMEHELGDTAAEQAAERKAAALDAVRQQLEDGAISGDKFLEAFRSIETSFRIEAIAEYEAQMRGLDRAMKDASIETEDYKQEQKALEEQLRSRVLDDLRTQLEKLPDAYKAAGRGAQELAEAQGAVQAQIDSGNRAVDRAVARAKDPNAHPPAGEHGGGIMRGIEAAGETLAVLPGELGHLGHAMENVLHISEVLSSTISSMGPVFAEFAGTAGLVAAGLVVAGGAIMALVSHVGHAVREMSALGSQFGLTIQEVDKLQTVLEHAGSSMGEFQRSSRILQQNLDRAADGSKAAGGALKILKIGVEDIQFKDAVSQTRMVVEALSKVENSALRTEVAVRLFGRSGAQFVAKFASDATNMARLFDEAAEAAERFKTAPPDQDVGGLVEASQQIAQIEQAGEALAGVLADAFAPLAGALGDSLANIIGTVTNLATTLVPLMQTVGGAALGPIKLMSEGANVASRIISSFGSIANEAVGHFAKSFLDAHPAIAKALNYVEELTPSLRGMAQWSEKIRDNFHGWMIGKTGEEIAAARAEAERLAHLIEQSSKIQEKYGDRTDEIKKKIEQINLLRNSMGADGKPLISADEAVSALDDLNKQLEGASPHIKSINAEGKEMTRDLERAKKAADEMGNSLSAGAYERYHAAYEELFRKRKDEGLLEVDFTKGLEGLAKKFDDEMAKAKPIKAIQDQIEALFKAGEVLNGFAKAADDFKKLKTLVDGGNAGGQHHINVVGGQIIKNLAKDDGVNMRPDETGIEKFKAAMSDFDGIEQIIKKQFDNNGAMQWDLADARNAAIRTFLKGNGAGPPEGPGGRVVDTFEASMKAIDEAVATIKRSLGKDAAGPLAEVEQGRMNAMNAFNRQNLDLVDSVIKGGQPDTRKNSAVIADSREGISEYIRIMRGGESVTAKQIDEVRRSRIILQKIADNQAKGALVGAGL